MNTQIQNNKPKYRYTPLWVRFITLSMFFGFLIVGIITIIYVQGNVIDLSDGGIVSTGSIRIESNVNDYKVFLNESSATVLNDQVNSVAPGEYIVRVEKTGYAPFETFVIVNEGLISFVPVQLFKNDATSTQVFTNPITHLLFDQEHSSTLFFEDSINPQLPELRYRSFNNSLISFVSSNERLISNQNADVISVVAKNFSSISVSPSGNKILVQDSQTNKWYIIPTDKTLSKEALLEDFIVNPLFTTETMQWLSDSEVIIKTDNTLYAYNPESSEYSLVHINEQSTQLEYYIDSFSNTVYIINNTNLLVYKNQILKPFALLDDDQATQPLFEFDTIHFAKNNIVIASDSINLYILHLEFGIFEKLESLNIVSISPDGTVIIGEDNGRFVSIQVSEKSISKSIAVTSNTFSTNFKNMNTKTIHWAQDSSFFLFMNQQDNQNLYSADPQGNRANAIFSTLESEEIINNFLIANNKESILIPIQNKKEADETSPTSFSVIRLEIK